MEAAIILGLVVWFIASIPQSLENARNRRAQEEREERQWQEERAMVADMRERAATGEAWAKQWLTSYERSI
jgi:hypothetical protein